MSKSGILDALRNEEQSLRSQLVAVQRAIEAIEGNASQGAQRGRKKAAKAVVRRKRAMTEEQRKAVAERMRNYWASRRAAKAQDQEPLTVLDTRRPIGPGAAVCAPTVVAHSGPAVQTTTSSETRSELSLTRSAWSMTQGRGRAGAAPAGASVPRGSSATSFHICLRRRDTLAPGGNSDEDHPNHADSARGGRSGRLQRCADSLEQPVPSGVSSDRLSWTAVTTERRLARRQRRQEEAMG